MRRAGAPRPRAPPRATAPGRRPTRAWPPGLRPCQVAPGSVHVAVAARADVAFGIERHAAQRARRPPSGDDLDGMRDEAARGRGLEPNSEEIGAVLVLVVVEHGDHL